MKRFPEVGKLDEAVRRSGMAGKPALVGEMKLIKDSYGGADFRTPNDRCNTDNLWNFWLQLCSGLTHNALGGFSIEALVVDGLAVAKLVEGLGELLIPGDEGAFEHCSNG
ncbi:MAG: hypothetical protein ACKVLL_11685 [Verrucomicrobiales bacterium]